MKYSKVAAFVTACTLSACSGGAPSILPAPQSQPATQVVTSNRTQHQKMATVSFSITWPSRRRRHGVYGKFISPSTKSVVLQEGSGKNAIVGIANYAGKATSQLKIQAPVGRDRFVVALYDRAQKARRGPVGNELGQGEVVQRIRADRVNTLHVVVDGVVSSINVSLDPSAAMAEITGTAGTQTLTLVGDLPATIVLTPVDADGNAIVAPGVVPSVSLNVPIKQGSTVSVAQSVSDANAYVISATGPSPSATFGLIAKAKDGQGNIAQTNVAGVQSQAIYVGYQNGSGSKIAVYDKSGKPLTLAAGAFSGVTQPVGLSYDVDDRLLFVADKTGKLLAFDGAGKPSTVFTPKTVAGINSVNYFNAQIATFPQYAISNPQRVIVGGSGGVTEFDAATGAQLAQTSLPFTPAAVAGFMDEVGYSASGWLVMVGNPAGSVDPYDLVTLAPYSANVSALNGGEKPTGFAAYLEPAPFGYSGDFCIDGKSVFPSSGNDSSCLYTVTGSASTIVRLGNVPGYSTPFGQYGVQGEYDQGRGSGVLSAIAVDQLNYYLDVTSSDTNSVHEYSVTDEYNYQYQTDDFGLGLSGSFVTPASLGLSSPNAIAVEW